MKVKTLSDISWYEESSSTIMLSIDRITISLDVDDFFYIAEQMDKARIEILNDPDYIVTSTIGSQGERKMMIIKKTDTSSN
jgi:extradiol dioxygenase family protein